MKRYDITNDYGCGYGVTPEENIDGEWVRHKDVELYVAHRVAGAIQVVAEDNVRKKLNRVECNCEFNFLNFVKGWVCPVHGYKKL